MKNTVNPFDFVEEKRKIKVESSISEASPISGEMMVEATIKSVEGKIIPVCLDVQNRVCLPLRKD